MSMVADDAPPQARLTETGEAIACDVCNRPATTLQWDREAQTWKAACPSHTDDESRGVAIMDLAARPGTWLTYLCEEDNGARLLALAQWLGEDGAWVLDHLRTMKRRPVEV